MPTVALRAIYLFLLLCATNSIVGAGYTEHLIVERLKGGLHWAQLTAHVSVTSPDDAWLLAAPLRRLGEQHGVKELEASLARGRWGIHGAPSIGSPQPALLPPPGLLLKVQFEDGLTDTEPAFRGLVESLGGLLGVPLARVTEDGVVAAPLVGWFGGKAVVRRQVYAALPREACCSGHLVAWTNLLPCRRAAGLAALLDPMALAAAPYLSLHLRLGLGQGDNSGGGGSGASATSSWGSPGWPSGAWMELTVSAVLPPRDSSSIRRSTQAPAGSSMLSRVDELLQRLLSRPLPAPCEAATSTTLQLRGLQLVAADSQTVSVPDPRDEGDGAGQGTLGGWECDGGLGAAAGDSSPAEWVSCGMKGSRAAAAAGGTAEQVQQVLGHPTPDPAVGGPALPAGLQVVRQVVPSGLTGGTLVLTARVPCDLQAPQCSSLGDRTHQRQCGEQQQQQQAGLPHSASLLHVFQVVPWQLPIQLHALRISLDGQVLELDGPQVAWHQILPSGGHFVASVVELLVQLPPCTPSQHQHPEHHHHHQHSEHHNHQQHHQQRHPCPPGWRQELRVAVGFRKRLLSVFQHAPDASRGVDIPAAQVTLVPGSCAALPAIDPNISGPATGSFPPSGPANYSQQHRCAVSSAHSAAHLVPLPVPDLSMPFNVCCFTSTLLAVYFGGMLNALLRPLPRPGPPKQTDEKDRGSLRAKLRRVLAICLLGAGLAFFLDKDLQRQADAYLQWLVVGRESHPAGEL